MNKVQTQVPTATEQAVREKKSAAKRANIGWVDLLRVMACFLVVVAHCCDPFVAQFDNNRLDFLTGAFTGSMVRCCVPLFVMMSGVLLLPNAMSTTEFYSKRLKRIILPLIAWSIIMPLLYFVYLNNFSTVSPNIEMETFTWSATLSKLYTFVFNFTYDTIPMWYMYMLVGLYLLMPILNTWLKHSAQKDIKAFLYIWGISLLLPYVKMLAPVLGYAGNYGNMGILGVCDWNEYGTFYYFSGFVGYLVLAYYLVKYPLDWSWKKTLSVMLPLFTVGYLITSLGFVLTQTYFPGSYANLEIVWYFAGINVFMMTLPVFVIIQKLNIKSSPMLSRIASTTFGIFLCHFVVVQMSYDFFKANFNLPPYVQMPLMAIMTFGISYIVVRVLMMNKFTSKIVA
ncbi:MAG: acyltransferase [Marinifilaceae bacterium]